MGHFWQHLRTGAWLTPSRLRAYTLAVFSLWLIGFITRIATADHLIDSDGKPIGTDFSSFYAAGLLVLDGRAADIYNMAAHHAREQQIFGAATPYYAWLYPPIFLLVATPLALMSYPVALAVWQGSTLLFYLAVIGLIVRSFHRENDDSGNNWILVALAFPAVFVNLGNGQNGFLTAALLGAALVALPRRPLVSGVLFGLLAYKPQFALVIPLALLAAGQWRTIAAAAVTVAALVATTAYLFGIDLWFAFAASTETSRRILLEQGGVGFEKLQSIFAAIRMWGGSVSLAYAVQMTASVAIICSVVWAWRSKLDHAQKATILIIATLLASPHVLDYDLAILGPAMAFFAMSGLTRGFRSFEITLLAAVWIVPLVARGTADTTGVPLGLLAMLAFYIAVLRRAAADLEGLSVPTRKFAEA